MAEPSARARAYLAAFAAEHQSPVMVPPMRSPDAATTGLGSVWRVLVPIVGLAAATVLGIGASGSAVTRSEPAKNFEAAPHRVERAVVEDVAQPRPHVRAFVRHRLPRIAEPPGPAATPPREAPRASGPSSLRRELALVDAAKASLRRGDDDAARRSLARHAQRFPNGLLAPERKRLLERIDAQTDSPACVHSSCEDKESTR